MLIVGKLPNRFEIQGWIDSKNNNRFMWGNLIYKYRGKFKTRKVT